MNGLTNTILIVDDNEDDVYALRRALRKAKIANPQQVVPHGQAAVNYLAGTGEYSDRTQFPLPFVVFLDLNTPLLNGFDVFKWIRSQPHFSPLAVVILTGSAAAKDDQQASTLGANAYLTKPPTPSDLETLMQTTEGYWLQPDGPTAASSVRQ
jgi:CheY-like chemotaxis protein